MSVMHMVGPKLLLGLNDIEIRIIWTSGTQVDEMGMGEHDLAESYTVPLPVKVIARLLGIPGDDYATFKRWSDAWYKRPEYVTVPLS